MVEGPSLFDAVGSDPTGVEHGTRIVDQDVDRGVAG